MPRKKSTHVDDPLLVGQRLHACRERAGISQRQLAFDGCSPAYISRVESGQRIPSLQLLVELAKRVGTTADYLAHGHGAGAVITLEIPLDLVDEEMERWTRRHPLRLADLDDSERDRLEHELHRAARSTIGPAALTMRILRNAAAEIEADAEQRKALIDKEARERLGELTGAAR